MKSSRSGDMRVQPISNLLVGNASKITNARDLQNDDAVVIIDDVIGHQDVYDPAWGERCLNDPDRLERPAIISRVL